MGGSQETAKCVAGGVRHGRASVRHGRASVRHGRAGMLLMLRWPLKWSCPLGAFFDAWLQLVNLLLRPDYSLVELLKLTELHFLIALIRHIDVILLQRFGGLGDAMLAPFNENGGPE